jgi:hypothetical protein
MPFTAGGADDQGSPIYGVKIPAGFREWSLINVAHEAADLNDFRVADSAALFRLLRQKLG